MDQGNYQVEFESAESVHAYEVSFASKEALAGGEDKDGLHQQIGDWTQFNAGEIIVFTPGDVLQMKEDQAVTAIVRFHTSTYTRTTS